MQPNLEKLTVFPSREIALAHRAYFVVTSESGHIVAISPDGSGSFFLPNQDSAALFRLPFEPGVVAISADGSLLALTGPKGHGLRIFSTSTFKQIHRLDDSFESSLFTPQGLLWTCIRFDSETVLLEVMDPRTWKTIARTKIADPYRDSFFRLRPHASPECVVAWAAAGQDGQCLFWACRPKRKIIAERFSRLDSTTWPSFSASGEEFLVICPDADELHLYSYPQGPLKASMPWPFDRDYDMIGDYVSYADAGRAILTSNFERLFLVDLTAMEIEAEIIIQGHEPGNVGSILRLSAQEFLSVHRDRLAIWRLPGRGLLESLLEPSTNEAHS